MRFAAITTLSLVSLVACSAANPGDGEAPAVSGSSAVSPELFRPPPPLTPTWLPWQKISYCGTTQGEKETNCADVLEATPGYAVGNSGEGTNSDPVLRGNGQGDGQYVWPFVCNDYYLEGSLTCSDGTPCCPVRAISLQTDAEGDAWWIDQGTHHIHFWVPGATSDVDLDAALGDGMQWQSVSAGAPVASASNASPSSQVWAITTAGSIYALIGYLDINAGQFTTTVSLSQYPTWFPVGGAAAQIGFMHETNATSLCGSGWHIPWVRTRGGQIFEFVPQENNCYLGTWDQLPGAANQLASGDVVLGTDDQVYVWNQGSWSFYKASQPPLPSGAHLQAVGAQPGLWGTIMAVDSTNAMWQDECGTLGC